MSIETILTKIEKQIIAGFYPGASLAIYRQGKWQEFYLGKSNPRQNQPTTEGLVYDLASVSKVVGVGTIFAFLVQRNAVDLDKSLKSYYPDFHDERVTVRQLLTHTSGLDPYIPRRDELNAQQLKEALHRLTVLEDKAFHYTDVNFLLLGFLLEGLYGQSLDQIFKEQIFRPWGMREIGFGPVAQAVPTVHDRQDGQVHDPKARVLGHHAGSAGLFSTVRDLQIFLNHYLQDDFAQNLTQNFAREIGKARSLAWNIEHDWLDHTGYTGTFIQYNRHQQKAAIFLSNRTYDKDEREQWIVERNCLMNLIKREL